MTRFGKWQSRGGALARLGMIGQAYGYVVGFTQIGGFARSLLFKRLLRRYAIPVRRVLDAGCGQGDYALYLAEAYPGATVTATDADGAWVERVQRTAREAGLRNLVARVQGHLELRDVEQFDLVMSIDSLQYSRDKREILRRFCDAAVAGGYVLIKLPRPHQRRLFNARRFARHDAEEGWRFDRGLEPHYELPELQSDLRALGCRIVHASYTTGFCGRLAFEVGFLIRETSGLLFALAAPLLKLVAALDVVVLNKKSGDGIVVLASKVGRPAGPPAPS